MSLFVSLKVLSHVVSEVQTRDDDAKGSAMRFAASLDPKARRGNPMDAATRFDDCVLQEILSRLPAKSLGQLKCTSKRWHNLISSPLFTATQACRSADNVLGILSITAHRMGSHLIYVPLVEDGTTCEAPNTSLGLPSCQSSRISIQASCNGLVFCRFNDPNMKRNRYILGNPTTKCFNYHVPEPSADRFNTLFGLAFDPSAALAALKLVACTRVCPSEQDPHYQFNIYSLQANAWRVSSTTMDCDHRKLFDRVSSVYFNGALHWLQEKGDIVAFDVESERAYVMSLPRGVETGAVGGYSDVWFGVARGRMSVVKFDGRGIRVWEKEEYHGGGWELKKCVEMAGDGSSRGGYYCRNMPLMYDGEKCILLSWSQEEEEEHDGEKCILLSWSQEEKKERQQERGLAVYRFAAGRWDQIRRLPVWMDCGRQFFPYISHMVGLV